MAWPTLLREVFVDTTSNYFMEVSNFFFLYLLVGTFSERFESYKGNFLFSFGFLMAWPTLQREAFADGLM